MSHSTGRTIVADAISAAVLAASDTEGWGDAGRAVTVEVERPANAAHGDYASSIAMRLAKPLRLPPLRIAQAIAGRVPPGEAIASVEVAAPGFINVRLQPAWLARQVDVIVAAGTDFGRTADLTGQRIQVEYVSANPTGPMTIANARGGPIGDVLANVMAFNGATVTREFYVNDAGGRVELLGQSVAVRYRELGGDTSIALPEDGYPADYIVEVAKRIRTEDGAAHEALSFDEQAALFTTKAQRWFVDGFVTTTERFGIHFDEWYFESELMRSGEFDRTLAALRASGHIEERDGALWLRSRDLGEDIDSVVVRSNGVPTYFGVDIAYHRLCLDGRGFDRKIDIWGANTHGHLRRMRTALAALELADRWDVVLYQYVRFLHEGVLLKMGKRLAQFLLLDDVIDAVGADVARWFFLQASADRNLDFDFELAVQQSNDNPVYYVQYAHARISSIFRTAAERGVTADGADVGLLTDPAEQGLIRLVLRFPELVGEITARHNVHLLTGYALELAGAFHAFYKGNRVVGDDPARSKARLRLVEAVQVALRQTLGLIGVAAPDAM
ncbi:MAG TPA: arginine--tRNA ligase [Candidatus Saccharimonadales bacterium]|nr:arginine--tRNA ligase [Candidatus Saccharimonadales bacterium]